MKKLSENAKLNLNKTAFWLSAIFSAVFALTCLLFLIYTITLTVATKSAVYFFFTFGLCVLSAEFSLLLFYVAFITVLPKTGKTYDKLQSISGGLNVAKITLAVCAAVFFIIFAAVGKTSGLKAEKNDYLISNGYYSEAKKMEIGIFENVDKIVIEMPSKNVIIKRTASSNVSIKYYDAYDGQVKIVAKNGKLLLTEKADPKPKTALNNMCFFLFDETANKKQIIVFVPENLNITVDGPYILAKN